MNKKVNKLDDGLLILQNLHAHITLDKRALDRCENNDSVVDPAEMSLGFSISGGPEFDQLREQLQNAPGQSMANKKVKKKKKIRARNQAAKDDILEASLDNRDILR